CRAGERDGGGSWIARRANGATRFVFLSLQSANGDRRMNNQSNFLETESEMLPQDPPPKLIRYLTGWLIALFIVALLAAIFVHLPETEHAAFTLIPREGADPIQSPRLATVSRVSVTEGQTVAAGAELFV